MEHGGGPQPHPACTWVSPLGVSTRTAFSGAQGASAPAPPGHCRAPLQSPLARPTPRARLPGFASLYESEGGALVRWGACRFTPRPSALRRPAALPRFAGRPSLPRFGPRLLPWSWTAFGLAASRGDRAGADLMQAPPLAARPPPTGCSGWERKPAPRGRGRRERNHRE